ncbi:MAG: IclR family transcriptional regulator [Micromonosporaceae bacterium]
MTDVEATAQPPADHTLPTEPTAVEPPAAESRGALGTIRNAVLLLNLLSDGPAHQQLTDLAERSGLSAPTAHRLLRSLVIAGLAEQEPHSSRYGLGSELVRLSQRYLGRLPVLAALSPYLLPVRDTIGASVHIALLTRGSVAYVDRIDGRDASLYRDPHRVLPALRTAAGRVLAARSDDTGWDQAYAIASPSDRALADTERDSWACAPHLFAEDPGGFGTEVAAPVLDGSRRGVAALAAVLPEEAVESAVPHLIRAAGAAGRTLGHG